LLKFGYFVIEESFTVELLPQDLALLLLNLLLLSQSQAQSFLFSL